MAALPVLFAATVPIIVLFAILQFGLGGGMVGALTRDPNAVSKAPFYVGFLSTVGIALWLGSALVAVIGAVLASFGSRHGRLLSGFAALTVVLALDDMLQLHEEVLPRYAGIPEGLTYLAYALALAFLMLRHFHTLIRNEPVILLTALAFMALSVFGDVIPERVPGLGFLGSFAFEDGCKLVGIVVWTLYFSRFVIHLARGEAD